MRLYTSELVKKYKARTVVDHVSIDVNQGEIVGLLGPNGAGKTTTFYMIVGLIKPNEGRIFLEDDEGKVAELTKEPVYKRAQMGVGYLAQEASVFRRLSVEDNIRAVLEMTDFSKEYQTERVESLIEEFRLQKVRKSLGIQLSDGFTALQVNFGGTQVNDFNQFGRSYKVMLQADTRYRSEADSLKFISVRSQAGDMIPLDTILTKSITTGPSSISRFNGVRSISIQGSAGSGYSSGEAMAAAEAVVKEIAPAGTTIEWSGQSREEQKSGSSTMKVLGLALVFAFLCLAALYESWSVPLAVLFTVPTGIFGAVFSEDVVNKLAALLGSTSDGYQNSVYMQIGIIMIIGLAAKNAILIVEFAKERVDHGMDPVDAVKEAAKLRFRPILMTAFTSIIGCLPLALATGAGAAARCGMGVAVVGGMCFATVFGIFLIPCFYLVTMVIARGLRSVAKGRGSGF